MSRHRVSRTNSKIVENARMDEFKNWVERRFVIEALQAKRAPELWQEVRSALQDACDSFNERYGSATDQVECALENCRRVRITRKLLEDHSRNRHSKIVTTIVVSFDENSQKITAAQNSANIFSISSDGISVFITRKDKRLEPDEVSKEILESFLFN